MSSEPASSVRVHSFAFSCRFTCSQSSVSSGSAGFPGHSVAFQLSKAWGQPFLKEDAGGLRRGRDRVSSAAFTISALFWIRKTLFKMGKNRCHLVPSLTRHDMTRPWLPDGKPKIPIWVNFKCLAKEDVGTYILWPFGTFYGHLVF
jgi:hypothetical protein